MRLIFEDDAYAVNMNKSILVSDSRQILLEGILSNSNDNIWCDRIETEDRFETCDELVDLAFSHAIMDLRKMYGNSMEDWFWGRIHLQHFTHIPFDDEIYYKEYPGINLGLVNHLFTREIASQGSGLTINIGPNLYKDKDSSYKQVWNASYRQIADMSSNDRGFYMISTGQSGNVASSHYDDLLEVSRKMMYLDMAVDDVSSGEQLILEPIK